MFAIFLRRRRLHLIALLVPGVLLIFLLGGFSKLPAPPPAPADLPLLDQTSLQYLGSFNVPAEDGAGNALTWGGNALAYDPDNTGLFFGCHDWYQMLGEVSVPAITNPPQTAAILQNCTDVTEGRLNQVDNYLPRLGGSLPYNDRLIVSAYGYYDADYNQTLSHFASSPLLSQTGELLGPYQVDSWPGAVSGYMTTIPEEWRSLFGGPALTGQCCIPIISRTSAGPAAFVFNPDNVGSVNPVPATTVLAYPLEHPLAPVETQNNYFNLATQIVGVAFPSGTRSVLFFGRQGTGPYCYGTGDECNDPVDPSHGTHAYPYRHQVWAYDALDLVEVRNGTMESWEVQPYAIWHLTGMDSTNSATVSGATYDPASGRVYITEAYGDYPAVHVYQIDSGGIFGDVPASYWAASWIERLYNSGITSGCATTPVLLFCPENNVSRAEMAVFLERGMHGATFTPPDVTPTFNDTVGHWAEDWIEALKNDGITAGCGAGSYCPESRVTRDQMALFLLRAEHGASYEPPAATGTVFSDVPADHWAAAWIEQLYAEGITGGCGAGTYCPDSPVTRAQMAVFLVRAFNLP